MTGWERRCPRGHTAVVERRNALQTNHDKPASRWYCRTCNEIGHDPHHDHLDKAPDGTQLGWIWTVSSGFVKR